jgi:hypothetical protein
MMSHVERVLAGNLRELYRKSHGGRAWPGAIPTPLSLLAGLIHKIQGTMSHRSGVFGIWQHRLRSEHNPKLIRSMKCTHIVQ